MTLGEKAMYQTSYNKDPVQSLESWHDSVDHYLTQHVFYQRTRSENDYVGSELPTSEIATPEEIDQVNYESGLLSRVTNVLTPNRNFAILQGSTGSGKSTALRHVLSRALHSENDSAPLLAYADGYSLGARQSEESTVTNILAQLYDELMEYLVDIWLSLRAEVDTSAMKYSREDAKGQRVRASLRHILLSSDIAWWIDACGSAVKQPTPEVERVRSLFEQCDDRSISVVEIADSISQSVMPIAAAVSSSMDSSAIIKNLLECVLGFYGSLLKQKKEELPQCVVCVVDNIDHIPTNSIHKLVNTLKAMFRGNNHARMLVALRPSSVTQDSSFTGFNDTIYHKAPNPFRLVYKRLTDNILSKSRAELSGGFSTEIAEDWRRIRNTTSESLVVFSNPPVDAEIDFLVATACVYRCVMWHGMRLATDTPPGEVYSSDGIHEDHKRIARIMVSPPAAKEVALTIQALTGPNARLSIWHCEKFLKRVYVFPTSMQDAISRAGKSVDSGPIYIRPFGYLAESIILGEDGFLHGLRAENLFAPAPQSGTPDAPSLTRAYLIRYMHSHSTSSIKVGELVVAMSKYGISKEECIACLSSMNDARRYLLWFSSNRDKVKKFEDEEVVLAARGRDYIHSLEYRFDYLWACSAAVHDVRISHLGLKPKIDLVIDLLEKLIFIEYEQAVYRAFFYEGTYIERSCITLSIVYGVIENISGLISRIVDKKARRHEVGFKAYADELVQTLSVLQGQLDRAEANFVMLFGQSSLACFECDKRKSAAKSVALFRESIRDLNLGLSSVDTLESRLEDCVSDDGDRSQIGLELLQKGEDIGTRAARFGAGLLDINGIRQLFGGAAELVRVDSHLVNLENIKGALGDLLERRVVRLSEIVTAVSQLLSELESTRTILQSNNMGVGGETLEKVNRIYSALERREKELERISTEWFGRAGELPSRDTMIERRAIFRRGMAMVSDLASELGLKDRSIQYRALSAGIVITS